MKKTQEINENERSFFGVTMEFHLLMKYRFLSQIDKIWDRINLNSVNKPMRFIIEI
jgi:hypothetical protein